MGRQLPKYLEYLHKIKLYLRICEIKLERKYIDTEALWIPSRRAVVVDRELEESTEIAVLLHELGHSLDDALTRNQKSHDRAYTAFYKGKASDTQKQLIRLCEERAWDNAEALARKLKIRLGPWFYSERKRCLRSYSSSTS